MKLIKIIKKDQKNDQTLFNGCSLIIALGVFQAGAPRIPLLGCGLPRAHGKSMIVVSLKYKTYESE